MGQQLPLSTSVFSNHHHLTIHTITTCLLTAPIRTIIDTFCIAAPYPVNAAATTVTASRIRCGSSKPGRLVPSRHVAHRTVVVGLTSGVVNVLAPLLLLNRLALRRVARRRPLSRRCALRSSSSSNSSSSNSSSSSRAGLPAWARGHNGSCGGSITGFHVRGSRKLARLGAGGVAGRRRLRRRASRC